MTRKATTAVLLATAVAAGCGGGDSDESGSAAKSNEPKPAATLKLSVVAKPGTITFDKKEVTVPAGRIESSSQIRPR